ncbi:DUF3413 domain-containing protein [Pseudoalteromonas fenneropenaei]|uniref:DUF3413 domain-containing protein n=1 Tax=Pseudoalteromonas fenneropenaei TaxID=1737459 RepID=A0ABV7CF13_9GAMM
MNLNPQHQFASKASQLLSWGHWFTFGNIALVLLISLSYLWADSAPTTWLGRLYMVVTWLSHTSFITFLAFVLTIFPLSLVFPYPRHIRGMAALVATLGLSALSLDAFVYFQLGYHLNMGSLGEIVSLLWQTLNGQPALTTILAVGLVSSFFAFELLISNFAWRHLAELKQLRFPRYAAASLVSCFALSHSIHIWADANSYFDITKQDNVLPMSYPTTAKSLLARHDLLDIDSYKQATTLGLEHQKSAYVAPESLPECKANAQQQVSVLVFANQTRLNEFLATQADLTQYKGLLQPSLHDDSIFNLIYGLPALYKAALMDNQQAPVWSKSLITQRGFTQLEFLTPNPDAAIEFIYLDNDAPLPSFAPEHQLVAFSLAAPTQQILVNGSFYTNSSAFKRLNSLLQPADITATLLAATLGCNDLASVATLGHDVVSQSTEQGVNYTQGVFVAYKKDRITLVAADGSYKHISAAEGFLIDQKLDVPFLVQSIKQLKRFSPKTQQ